MTRKLLTALFAIGLVGLIGSTGARAGTIVGSSHDLSQLTTTTADVCVFCHTPHNTADPATLPVPLWNRNAPATASFTMYSSASIDMVIATQPQGVSLACLSCHDGITAYDSLVRKPGGLVLTTTMGTGFLAVGAGGDLTNDHPISVTYATTGANSDPAFFAAVGGKVGALPLFRAPGATGTPNQVECASCHNPHEPDFGKFLRISNAGSGVCISCHIK